MTKDYLPQSQSEWESLGKFEIGHREAAGEKIHSALIVPENIAPKGLAIMIGGIPRSPERRQQLPLINKLYGYLALKLSEVEVASLLYNQPATGNSTGELTEHTFKSRFRTLAELGQKVSDEVGCSKLHLVGNSAGAYIAARSIETLHGLGLQIESVVLQSPAAYPVEVEGIPYGEEFRNNLFRPWEVKNSPVFADLRNFLSEGGRIYGSYFQKDDPPIPLHIQTGYNEMFEEMIRQGNNVTTLTVVGVEHNFRRIGSDHSANVVNNDSVRSIGARMRDFIIGAS